MTQAHSFRTGFRVVKPKPNGNNSSQSQGRKQFEDNLKDLSRVQVKDLVLFLSGWHRIFFPVIFSFFSQLLMKTWSTRMRIALVTPDWKTVVKERFQSRFKRAATKLYGTSHRIGWENDIQAMVTMFPSPKTIELRVPTRYVVEYIWLSFLLYVKKIMI